MFMKMSINVDVSGSEANVTSRTHFPNHILIIGAGITGLTLAQSLKKAKVPFTIFERDPTPFHRGSGWGLTIHWALDTFTSLLPQHLVARLPEVFVDPDASKRGDNGNFLFFDLRSGEARWKVPPNKRIRVSRERLRKLLMDGIDIQVHSKLRNSVPGTIPNVRLIVTAVVQNGLFALLPYIEDSPRAFRRWNHLRPGQPFGRRRWHSLPYPLSPGIRRRGQ